jgi:hypothetical protein
MESSLILLKNQIEVRVSSIEEVSKEVTFNYNVIFGDEFSKLKMDLDDKETLTSNVQNTKIRIFPYSNELYEIASFHCNWLNDDIINSLPCVSGLKTKFNTILSDFIILLFLQLANRFCYENNNDSKIRVDLTNCLDIIGNNKRLCRQYLRDSGVIGLLFTKEQGVYYSSSKIFLVELNRV